jgi:hypothetical protein
LAVVIAWADFEATIAGSAAPLASGEVLFFHQHRGKRPVSACVFINIVARPKSGIFSPCVFNNIARLTCIFNSPFFRRSFVCPRDKQHLINNLHFHMKF